MEARSPLPCLLSPFSDGQGSKPIERVRTNVQSQGTEREATRRDRASPGQAGDRGQLERSAEVFEMILQTSPDAVENYLTLKDIYRQLERNSDLKRIIKGLAQVYLNSSQAENAANQYAEVLEIDPGDAEVVAKLRELGYAPDDAKTLRLKVHLQEIRGQCEQKLQELEKAEQAFLKASAKVRDARRGDDEETGRMLRAIEEAAEKELRELLEEHERWLRDGRTEVFNQVAEGLKKKADRIIEEDEFGDVRKSVKKAEKILAGTDRVFEEEWRRLSEEREREFQQKTGELKRKHEMQLRSAWQEWVARSERDQAAADLALRKVKEELRVLQATLREKEKTLGKDGKTPAGQPGRAGLSACHAQAGPPQARPQPAPSACPRSRTGVGAGSADAARVSPPPSGAARDRVFEKPDVVVVAPPASQVFDETPQEMRSSQAKPATARDEVGKALGAILVQHGLVTRERLDEAITKQGSDRRPIGEILVEAGYATQEDIINALVAQAGVPYLPLNNYDVSEEVASLVSGDLARKLALMPVDKIGGSLLVAMGIPLNNEHKEELLRHLGGLKVKFFISSWSDIKAKHEQHYS